MTLHDDRSRFNQMLLDQCFCMRLQDDTADCEGGGGLNQMFLELCLSVMLMMRGGGSNQLLLGPCFSVTLNDEREGSNQMLLEQCSSMRPQADTA